MERAPKNPMQVLAWAASKRVCTAAASGAHSAARGTSSRIAASPLDKRDEREPRKRKCSALQAHTMEDTA